MITGVIVVLASVAAFLAAAKSHGRQLRLEREVAGYWEVRFGGTNPPFVAALWRRDRVRFWAITLPLGLAWLAWRLAQPGSRWWELWLPAVLWAPSVAFVALGAASLLRFGAALRRGSPPGRVTDAAWLRRAIAGSAAWWLVTLVLIAAVGWAVRGARPSA